MIKQIFFLLLLHISFSSNAQDVLYIRCVDADNLVPINEFVISSDSKKIILGAKEKGILMITGLDKGDQIQINSVGYHINTYRRFTKKQEIAAKHNGESFPESGDTLVIELQMEELLVLERWKLEDALFSDTDTMNLITKPDKEPAFVNAENFNRILTSNLHFPRFLADEGYGGRVVLSAIVELDGTFSNIHVIRSLEPHLDRIAIRALRSKELPKLNPAQKDGIPVRRKIIYPVSFNLR